MVIIGFLQRKHPFPPNPNFSREDWVSPYSISRVDAGCPVPVSLIISSGMSE